MKSKNEVSWQSIVVISIIFLALMLIITIPFKKHIPTGFVINNQDGTDFITTYEFRDSINNKAYYTSDIDTDNGIPEDSPEEIASDAMPASPDDYTKLASIDNDIWMTGFDNGNKNA